MQVYAEIDVSIFSNNTDYNVDIDEMDDTGTITFSEGDDEPSNVILGSTDENNEDLIMGSFDIKMIEENSLAVFRMSLVYMGDDWIFGDDVIIKTDNKRYAFEVDRDTEVEDGKIYEMYTLAFSDKLETLER